MCDPQAGLKRQREYLEESRDEAHWSRKGGWQQGERLRSSEALIDIQEMQLTRLLTLMQAVVSLWSSWSDGEGKLARILQPTRTAFLKLKVRLAVWLERIADGLEGGREEQLGLAAFEHGETVRRSLRRFEACYIQVIVKIGKEFRGGKGGCLPENEIIVPFHAFIFCTRALVRAGAIVA